MSIVLETSLGDISIGLHTQVTLESKKLYQIMQIKILQWNTFFTNIKEIIQQQQNVLISLQQYTINQISQPIRSSSSNYIAKGRISYDEIFLIEEEQLIQKQKAKIKKQRAAKQEFFNVIFQMQI